MVRLRLRLKADSPADVTQTIDAFREQAAKLASFDPSPEATLARRYEATAERGMYRAMKAIAEIRLAREIDLPPLSRSNPLAPSSTPAPRPASLGSFRCEVLDAPNPPIRSPLGLVEPTMADVERRKKRPDLRKLAKSRGHRS